MAPVGEERAEPAEVQASEGQLLAEQFAAAVAPGIGDEITLVMARPWSSGTAPGGVLAPSPGPDPWPDRASVSAALGRRSLVLVPCTLDDSEEQFAADQILPNIQDNEHTSVFMALLFPPGLELDHEVNNQICAKYSRLLGLGFDEVIVDPPPEPAELRRAIGISYSVLELNGRRMHFMLETEAEPVQSEQLADLRAQHHRLLWESIPHALMPYFTPLNRNLVEGPRNLERYQLLRRIDSAQGRLLLLALDEQQAPHVVKVIDKNNVTALGQLECIYREYRFLSAIIRHPHVARCVEMLHSPTHIYFIFEFSGSMNLMHVLQNQPGQRLEAYVSLDIFNQVGSAVAFCHSRHISHRQISLPHVVVRPSGERYQCTLVDFHKAMMARGESTSLTVCGSLPFIAPEMAMGRAYVPHHADAWSLGVVLLETAGGMGSMGRFIGYNEKKPEASVVGRKQLEQFSVPGSHELALACVGAVSSDPVSSRLAMLLKPSPAERALVRKTLVGKQDSHFGKSGAYLLEQHPPAP